MGMRTPRCRASNSRCALATAALSEPDTVTLRAESLLPFAVSPSPTPLSPPTPFFFALSRVRSLMVRPPPASAAALMRATVASRSASTMPSTSGWKSTAVKLSSTTACARRPVFGMTQPSRALAAARAASGDANHRVKVAPNLIPVSSATSEARSLSHSQGTLQRPGARGCPWGLDGAGPSRRGRTRPLRGQAAKGR